MPRMSSSGVASGSVAGNASATSPSMLTRTRLGWSIDSATPERWAASAAAASDWIARAPPIGDGDVSATSGQRAAADPLRNHQPAGAGAGHVEHPRDAGHIKAAELQRARQDLLHLLVGQRRVRVDEGQRDLPVQRGVERLPELQVGRAAVEDQQPVAAAADGGARNEVDVLVGGGGLDRRFPWRGERDGLTGGIAAVIGGRAAGDRHRRGAVGGLGKRRGLRGRRRVVFDVVGRHVGREVVGRRARNLGRGGAVGARCGAGRLVVGHRWSLPHPVPGNAWPEARAGPPPGIDDGVTRTNCSDQRT